jgi:acetate kinase
MILAVNGGSSSVKFALFDEARAQTRVLSGQVERIGLPGSVFRSRDERSGESHLQRIGRTDHRRAVRLILAWLKTRRDLPGIRAVGHRIVHGGSRYRCPVRIGRSVHKAMKRLSRFVPEHLPAQICIVEAFRQRFPRLPQVACFDTAFHRSMPKVARTLPIPRRYARRGIERYGFHGLSYSYLMKALASAGGRREAAGRVVLAHLGNGASLAAVHHGQSRDTTMAFTPAAGIPMSTRSGDLDPGLVLFLVRNEQMTVEQFHRMVNTESGLLGVSGTSSDMRDLLRRAPRDVRAREAVDLFCYRVRKEIAGLAAALGGLDTLVFSGGIGENSSAVRARVCRPLGFLGVRLDEKKNRAGTPLISRPSSRVKIRVIRTDEEKQIAQSVMAVLGAR